MNRKLLVWMLAPVLLTALYGCPKKKPQTVEPALDLQSEAVTSPPPTEAAPPPASLAEGQEEDPLLSSDLQAVNDELRRRGFSANVYFEYDEWTLSDETRDSLARNADLMRGAPQLNLLIEGHCDERGTNEYNLALGERRASAVRAYLASLGVSDQRLQTLSYGEERPVCTQSDESCWSQNRRAHMLVTGRSNVG